MAYIGVSPSNGVRRKHTYTATAAQTDFTGAGAEGITLGYLDSNYVDVYQNGVKLSEADYTSTSGTAIVLAQGASVSDIIEVVVYDVFSVADTVSKSAGGTFDADVTFADGADIITASAGTSNFRAGVNAGNSIASGGNYNTVIGDEAGTALTTGDSNVAIGFEALATEDANGLNVAVGYRALKTLNASGAAYNTAVGYDAGTAITTSQYNTIVGGLAADALTTGNENTAIGVGALGTETAGDRNVAVGNGALTTQNITGGGDIYNTAVGYSAGTAVTTGVNNTLIGGLAGDALTDADDNIAIGTAALTSDTKGSKTVAIGKGALQVQNFTSATDSYNTAVGDSAGLSVTTGVSNTLIGASAGDALTDADFNVAVGHLALSADTLGSKSVAIGEQALTNQNFTSATDAYNVAIGRLAGEANLTGEQNVFIGGLAGDASNTDHNTFVGFNSGGAVTSGFRNSFFGKDSGDAMTTGDKNIIIGSYGGNEGGLDIRASDQNIVISDGNGNPRMITNSNGFTTLTNDRSPTASRLGAANAHVIHSHSSGNIMCFIENTSDDPRGMMFDFSQAAPDNNTNFFMKFEDSSAERAYIYSDGDMYNHDGTFAQISDTRIKDNITDANAQWDDIKAMRFVNYQRKDDIRQYGADKAKVQLGLIGQELEAVSPNLVRSVDPNKGDIIGSSEFGTLYEDGDDIPEGKEIGDVKEIKDKVKGVAYSILYMKAVKALQEAMTRIETLEAKVTALEG